MELFWQWYFLHVFVGCWAQAGWCSSILESRIFQKGNHNSDSLLIVFLLLRYRIKNLDIIRMMQTHIICSISFQEDSNLVEWTHLCYLSYVHFYLLIMALSDVHVGFYKFVGYTDLLCFQNHACQTIHSIMDLLHTPWFFFSPKSVLAFY